MIHVALVRNVFEPGKGRSEFLEPWREGLTPRDVLPADWPADNVVVFDGTRKVDLDQPVRDGSRVVLALAPAGLPFVVQLVALFFISLVLRSFLPKPPRQRGDDASAANGFSGIQSNRTEGEPIPCYYGRRQVGGQIVSEFIENKGALGSFYNVLLSLGEGPIYRVMGRTTDTDPDAPLRSGDGSNPIPPGWLFVNDGDAADIEDAEVHVRLGSIEQKAIPGFAFVTQTVSVDADIEGPAGNFSTFAEKTWGETVFGSTNRNPLLASDNATSSNGLWTEYGTAYSMTSEADEFSVTVEFPGGLGKTADDGFPLSWYFALGVRYIELDGGGSPITTGGAEGDGYARLPAVPIYRARYAPGARVDLRYPFYDPQTYTRPSYSRTLRLNASTTGVNDGQADNFARNTDFQPFLLSPDATSVNAFTFEAWICLRPSDPTLTESGGTTLGPGNVSQAPIFTWFSTTAFQKGGFDVSVKRKTFTIAPGQTRQRLVPVLSTTTSAGVTTEHYEKQGELGDATFQVQLQGRTVPESDWFHVVCSYKPNASGTQDRVRIYADGELIAEKLGTFDLGYPLASSSVGIQANMGASGSSFFKGWMDNMVLWWGEMTADDVRLAYNGGLGRTLPSETTYYNPNGTTRLFSYAIWNFDTIVAPGDGAGNGETVLDSSSYGLNFTTVKEVTSPVSPDSSVALGTASDQSFILQASATNTRKRGRYKVEVMRGLKLVNGSVVQDAMKWSGLQLHTDALYTYPSSPMLGVRVKADGEINGSAPNLKVLGDWRLLPVWDGASTTNPTFVRQFSRNPAWVCVDVAIDPIAGLSWIFRPEDIDVASWQEFADFCDEVVYDQRGLRMEYPDWTDMFYSSVLLGTSPGIQVRVPTGTAPRHWAVGAYIGWYGLPAITAVGTFEDTNVDATGGGGYEIVSVSINPGGAGLDYYNVRWEGALAPWTNSSLLSTQITAPMAGTIEGREPRFLCDEAKDDAGSAWDFIVQVCAAARAVPIRDGSRLRVRVDKARPVRDVIGQAQVIPGTFEYEPLSPKTRVNSIDISFPDADLAYERSQVLDEHPSIRGTTALADIRRRSYSLDGVTRRSQVLRHARYLLNREHLIRRRGRFRASLDMLGYEPGDVIQIAHDVADRGTGGRVLEYVSATELKLDRAVTLESGKTYRVLIRYQSAPDGEEPQILDVDEATTGLGEKKGWDGDVITFTTTMTREAQKGDAIIWYEIGRELYASIESISLTRDLQREVTWTQYDETIFDVEGRDDLADVDAESYVTAEPGRGARSIPLPPDSVRARELTTLSASGTAEHSIEVRWTRSESVVGVAGYDVYTGGRGAWIKAASLGAGADRAIVPAPSGRGGIKVSVSVVARSPDGRSRNPDAGARASVRMLQRPLAPASPLALYAAISADLAVYTWVPGEASDSTFYELRRGGWILGQPVHLSGPGETSFGSSPSWVTSAPIADGSRTAVPYYVRARSPAGSFSGAAKASWNPRATDYAAIEDSYDEAFWSVSWEEFGHGWEWTDATTPNTTITDLVTNPGGWLEFDGSALTGTFTTPEPLLIAGVRPETVHLSSHVEAEQIHPLTWDEDLSTWDDPTSCQTWEGPLDVIEDGEDSGRCSLSLEVRLKAEDGIWSNWQEYRPTRARCLSAQFRVTVTRPSTDFDVRIHRFSTDLQRVPRSRWERSAVQALAEGKVFRRG